MTEDERAVTYKRPQQSVYQLPFGVSTYGRTAATFAYVRAALAPRRGYREDGTSNVTIEVDNLL